MRHRLVILFAVVSMFCGMSALICAAQPNATKDGQAQGRVDLKTQTLVGKTLTKVESGPDNKKVYHYTYRVQAKPTQKEMPRYAVDHQYNVSYQQSGFKDGDSVKLRSNNSESASDSPIFVYDVTYSGGGTRSLNFSTSGSVMSLLFAAADSENEPFDGHCGLCRHETVADCQASNCQCRCCVDDQTNCNCSGCQYQNPRCFACPVGCNCSHCVCSCDGCLTQSPRCLVCPVGCTCDHCRCQCEESIDHLGRCGCVLCKQKPAVCECECHKNCP